MNVERSAGMAAFQREREINEPSCLCMPFMAIAELFGRVNNCYRRTIPRPCRNVINLSCAGFLAFAGAEVSADLCVRACLHIRNANEAARIGATISAVGNVWSTYADCESDADDRIVALERQINAQENRIQILEGHLNRLTHQREGQSL